ncbi:MAG: primosomal protein N' [Pseudomonadota bacterium]
MIASDETASDTVVLKVALPVPLSRLFDYLPSGEIMSHLPGARVRVPFGRSFHVGVIVAHGPTDFDIGKLKPVSELLDPEPLLPADILALLKWAAGYYHCPIGEVFATALPIALRKAGHTEPKRQSNFRITGDGLKLADDALNRAPVQKRLLQFIKESDSAVTGGECRLFDERWSTPMKQLIKKGLVSEVTQSYPDKPPPSQRVLNEQQQQATDAVIKQFGDYHGALLHGVTGSGKTEVYIELVREQLHRGGQTFILLPEIGLTPQLLSRFRSALQCHVEVLHSGLNASERLLAWRAAASGDAKVLIGTRSSVFAPLPQLGLIIVDEEHDGALKQQDGFRYHARDLAIVRAQRAKVPIVLGSATPSLESLHNVDKGLLSLHPLTQRAGGARSPALELVDSRGGDTENGVSKRLLKRMEEVLGRGEQVIVFINRRGYSPVLMCEACNAITDCNNCDAHMTVHARTSSLRCHHCGAERPLPRVCGSCEAEALIRVGAGTERIDEFLSEKFPDYTVLRIDRDSTSRKGELQRHLAMAASGEAQILVGTQMLAKGHDFPNVTLVGIMDADRGLFGADFRATEQMGQLITQVAGRAGRADKPGTVLIQSRNPEHPLLHLLLAEGYSAFTTELLTERKTTAWPPYVYTALVRCEHAHSGVTFDYLEQVRSLACHDNINPGTVQVLGPAHAPMERVAGRHRAQLLLLCDDRKPLHAVLGPLRPLLEEMPESRKVRWSIDVDPHDML